MKLQNQIPQDKLVLSIAEKVLKKFKTTKGQCEFMSKELTQELRKNGIFARHIMGNFHLDEPGAFEYISPEDEEGFDEYAVNHDWVSIEGKILDISATQFQDYVHEKIPAILYADYTHPLAIKYEELGHVEY